MDECFICKIGKAIGPRWCRLIDSISMASRSSTFVSGPCWSPQGYPIRFTFTTSSLSNSTGTQWISDLDVNRAQKECPIESKEVPETPAHARAHAADTSTVKKKPLVAKRTGKSGGLGARKLTTDTVFARSNNTTTIGSSFPSRFEYAKNVHSTERSCGGPQTISHVVPPNPSSFFAEFGTDSGFPKRGNSKFSEVQVGGFREYVEAINQIEGGWIPIGPNPAALPDFANDLVEGIPLLVAPGLKGIVDNDVLETNCPAAGVVDQEENCPKVGGRSASPQSLDGMFPPIDSKDNGLTPPPGPGSYSIESWPKVVQANIEKFEKLGFAHVCVEIGVDVKLPEVVSLVTRMDPLMGRGGGGGYPS
ncbi:hypothetical protein Nepgr_028603 [Nepenthes gracilis]|uniref:Uncharacterized protein n=1 Tax=Nepenthes gracilis TaxID=150966 RepID=A0AAD3Y442_NEPGR|nr:hypothetical protein Nepgr_028603 [Nepenthes gracilis]